jgi:phage-related protein
MTSKPIITIVADEDEEITLKLAGVPFMTVTMPPEGTITIDNEALNCYNSNADKNQYVEGHFIELASGANSISWDGDVTSVTIKPNSRWL